jgi:hypothetical protein
MRERCTSWAAFSKDGAASALRFALRESEGSIPDKGSVLVQRKLFDRFEQSDDTYAGAEFHLRWLGRQICEG